MDQTHNEQAQKSFATNSVFVEIHKKNNHRCTKQRGVHACKNSKTYHSEDGSLAKSCSPKNWYLAWFTFKKHSIPFTNYVLNYFGLTTT